MINSLKEQVSVTPYFNSISYWKILQKKRIWTPLDENLATASVSSVWSCDILTHPIVELTEAHALTKNLQLIKHDLEIKVLKWSNILCQYIGAWYNFWFSLLYKVISLYLDILLSTSRLLDAIVDIFWSFWVINTIHMFAIQWSQSTGVSRFLFFICVCSMY